MTEPRDRARRSRGRADRDDRRPASFTVLFLVDAATFLIFAAVLAWVPEPALPPTQSRRDARPNRDVLKHSVFVRLVGLNVVFVTAGYAQIELLPVFAHNEAGVGETAIGLIFLVNTVTIVLAQLRRPAPGGPAPQRRWPR